ISLHYSTFLTGEEVSKNFDKYKKLCRMVKEHNEVFGTISFFWILQIFVAGWCNLTLFLHNKIVSIARILTILRISTIAFLIFFISEKIFQQLAAIREILSDHITKISRTNKSCINNSFELTM